MIGWSYNEQAEYNRNDAKDFRSTTDGPGSLKSEKLGRCQEVLKQMKDMYVWYIICVEGDKANSSGKIMDTYMIVPSGFFDRAFYIDIHYSEHKYGV